jgi:hypothetical protein
MKLVIPSLVAKVLRLRQYFLASVELSVERGAHELRMKSQ